MTRRRARGEGGTSLVELVVTAGLLLVVTTPMLMHLATAQTRQKTAADSASITGEGRVALALVARDIRQSRRLTDLGSNRVVAWSDRDRDDVVDAGEEITYAIDGDALTRSEGTTTRTLVEPVIAGSHLQVRGVGTGNALDVALVVDPSSSGAEPVTLRLEVTPRVER